MKNIFNVGQKKSFGVTPTQTDAHVPLPSENDLLFFPLGGSGEIGMNVNLYGHNKQWIMVDLGITFPDSNLGLQLITANLDIIKRSNIGKNLKGVVITHAHEDHIGAVHELWPYFKFHIYLTKFSKHILLKKLDKKPYLQEIKDFYLHEIPYHGHIQLGHFKIDYLGITHSIPESNALFIKTPAGNILHTGDWKLDPAPVLGEPTNTERYKKLSKENVMAMICDSTNALDPGRSGSEESVAKTFDELFKKHQKNRIIVTCFASNVARIKSIADAGMKLGRKICLFGISIHRMIDSAEKCQFPLHTKKFINEESAMKLPPEKVLFICTGSQGDENAALSRMARNVHKIKLRDSDVVIFSSKKIPGNERRINLLQNNLTRLGVKIITEKEAHVHVSGHPCRDELKELYEWVKPKYIVPVHGEMRHLQGQADFAKQCGYKTLLPENGTLISLTKKCILKRYDIGRSALDGKRFINMESSILKNRAAMGAEGAVFLTVHLAKSNITINTSGLIDADLEQHIKRLTGVVRKLITSTHYKTFAPHIKETKIRDALSIAIRSSLGKNPEIFVHLI